MKPPKFGSVLQTFGGDKGGLSLQYLKDLAMAKLVKFELPQHVNMSFDNVILVLKGCLLTNYVSLPRRVGKELRGAPMGD